MTRRFLHCLLPALATFAAAACARPNSTPAVDVATVHTPLAHGDFSVYELGSAWRDQTGRVRELASLRGAPRVLAFVYTHCSAACPITIAELKRIAAVTPAAAEVVLVSLDPSRDTPEQLARYAAEHGLTQRWTLLSGSDASVRDLAATLGVRYERLSSEDLAHGNVLTVLDAEGQMVHQQSGLDGSEETVRVLRELAR